MPAAAAVAAAAAAAAAVAGWVRVYCYLFATTKVYKRTGIIIIAGPDPEDDI